MRSNGIEREHVPAAQELGLAICPWSPLAGGFLTGKYQRHENTGKGEGRLDLTRDIPNPGFQRFTERNWKFLEVLLDVAKQLDRSPAQVALNWAATQPGITSTIIGASKPAQFEDNLRFDEFEIPGELRKRLDQASAIESGHPIRFQSANSGSTAAPIATLSLQSAPPSRNPRSEGQRRS